MDLLQQLRDIEEPLAPGIFPLAIGWYALTVVVAIVLVTVVYLIVRYVRTQLPYWRIRRLASNLVSRYRSKLIHVDEFVDRSNALFKWVLIELEGRREVVSLYGMDWQFVLQERFSDERFMTGDGAIFGLARFTPEVLDLPDIGNLIAETLGRIKPQKHRST